jgi:hypothetical protein
MASKFLDLKMVMRAADGKDYDFYDKLSDEDKKAFSPYLTLRWMASVGGSADAQAYYLISTNENVNKNFWDISKHHKLAWLSIAAAAPGIGSQQHYWVNQKKTPSKNKLRGYVASLFPAMKEDEISLFMETNSEQDIAEWLTQFGMDPKEIKALLK